MVNTTSIKKLLEKVSQNQFYQQSRNYITNLIQKSKDLFSHKEEILESAKEAVKMEVRSDIAVIVKNPKIKQEIFRKLFHILTIFSFTNHLYFSY